jgi:hypothetical protein
MSILIKGMQMPKECLDCPMCDINDDCVLQKDERFDTWEEQKKDCPLIEVPKPHGRLIDGDALQCKVDDIGLGYYEVLGVTEDTIDSAPTIIEAEGR